MKLTEDQILKTLICGPEAIEAEGQACLVSGELLPANDSCDRPMAGKLEAIGIRCGKPCPDDPLFMPVNLPEGWSKRPTDHAMWSEVVDDQGKVRVSAFYKASFYDRRAYCSVPAGLD